MLRQRVGHKRQGGGVEHGCTHIDRDQPVITLVQGDDAALHLHADGAFIGQPLLAHKAHKTARAVAAVFHLAAIGVVDAVGKIHIGRGRWPYGQDLVGAHAEMAVGQKAVMLGAQPQLGTRFVQHDKVVAGALHFGKGYAHGSIV